jgi:hypothetical protein
MVPFEEAVAAIKAAEAGQLPLETPIKGVANEWAGASGAVTAATQNN